MIEFGVVRHRMNASQGLEKGYESLHCRLQTRVFPRRCLYDTCTCATDKPEESVDKDQGEQVIETTLTSGQLNKTHSNMGWRASGHDRYMHANVQHFDCTSVYKRIELCTAIAIAILEPGAWAVETPLLRTIFVLCGTTMECHHF